MTEYYKLNILLPKNITTDADSVQCAQEIIAAIKMREKYVYSRSVNERDDPSLITFKQNYRADPFSFHLPPKNLDDSISYSWKDGVINLSGVDSSTMNALTYEEFVNDLKWLYFTVCCGKKQDTFCSKRVKIVETCFNLYVTLNQDIEETSEKDDSMDFYRVTKVDNHIHGGSTSTQKELLIFIKNKLVTEGDRVVNEKGDTLAQCCARSGIRDPNNLHADRLGVDATSKMFHRYLTYVFFVFLCYFVGRF